MLLKCIFDRVVSLIGLFFLWPVLLIVPILVKIKMPGVLGQKMEYAGKVI